MKQPMKVEMDDGTVFDVDADARDIRAWEAQYGRSFFEQGMTFTTLAQIAYLAGRRTNLLNGQWPDYEDFDAHCVDVVGRPDPVTADPTRPAVTAGSCASSPSNSTRSRPKSNVKARK